MASKEEAGVMGDAQLPLQRDVPSRRAPGQDLRPSPLEPGLQGATEGHALCTGAASLAGSPCGTGDGLTVQSYVRSVSLTAGRVGPLE